MRILLAAERLGHAGGMERYLEIVVPALRARGATVRILARRIDAAPAGTEAEVVAWSEEHEPPSAAARSAVERALSAFAPDVAVAHNVMDAGVVAALRGAPRLVYHVHDHRPFCPNGDRVFPRSGRICTQPMGRACAVHALTEGCGYGPRRRTLALIRRRQAVRDAIARAERVVVASEYLAEQAARNGIEQERLEVIPLPLPDEAYAPPGPPPASRAVVFAGRVVPQKGLGSLVRALGRVAPDRRPLLRAFGAGPQLAAARDDAARLGVALEAPGAVEAATVRAAIDDAALVALPSLWAEPFGYTGIEAFARSRPVVAYDVGGVGAWLADGLNGVAVPRGDEARLAAAIDALLADDARRAALGERARVDAERYRAEAVVDALLKTYRDA